jgi:CubicO group peptidase (beta-lactamase class C family)
MKRLIACQSDRSARFVRRHGLCLTILSLALLGGTLPSARAGGLPTARPEDVGVSSERLGRIHEAIQRHIDEHRIAGAVTLVARRGRVVHFESHGLMDIESKKPMAKHALFRMASSTKPVAGVAVMMMVEEGKVHLADPVSKFIPEFKTMKVAVEKEGSSDVQIVAADREITIKDLLTHTSGLFSGGAGTRKVPREAIFPSRPDETLATLIPRLAAHPLDFQPGMRWRYSGLAGIDTLSRIVEVASRLPFDQFLKRRIFEPLGMDDTSFVVPEDLRDRQATVYRVTEKGLEKSSFTLRFPKTYFSGAGGLVSTAADYSRFAQMLLNRGQLDGLRLLSPRAVQLLSSNQVGEMFAGQAGRPKGMGFGFTVEVVVDSVQAGTFRSNGSYGWDGAFGTHFWVDPKAQMIAVLMIQTSAGRVIHRDFETAVMQAIVD